QHGPLDRQGDGVERATQVPELDGAAEDRDRARRFARRPLSEGGLPRARDLGDALLRLAGEAARGRPRGARRPRGTRGRAGLRRRVAERERALGRKTYELEIAVEASAGWE